MPDQFTSPEGDLENYFITESWLIDQWIGDRYFAWGNNFGSSVSAVAVSIISSPTTPNQTYANTWKQISAGYKYAAAVKTDGTLWTWGTADYGGLGINSLTTKSTPVTTFAGGTNWKQIDCASTSIIAAIKTDGTLWTWGWNQNQQLGINAANDRSTPVTTFAGGTDWKQVSSGTNHTAAIKTDGTLWIWGTGDVGQLGINALAVRSTPVTTFAGGTNWKQVACGFVNTAAIKTDGTLWTWGRNIYGNIGDNTTTQKITPVTTFAGGTNWKQVTCGYEILAIKTDGTLWTWGRGGQGDNTTTPRSTPITTFAGGTNWKQVSSGNFHNAAIKTDGTLWTWGANSKGQLGLGDTTYITRSTPVTTIAGGTNWKQVACGTNSCFGITSGEQIDIFDPTIGPFPIPPPPPPPPPSGGGDDN